MQLFFKNLLFFCGIIIIFSCNKQENLVAQPVPVITDQFINFKEDTSSIKLTLTTARKESIGNFLTTAIEGKLPDSIIRKNNLIIRVTGDSARVYNNTEIFVSYTDSLGATYSNALSDTINKVKLTKLEKKKGGLVTGDFTIRVSNSTKTKTFLLSNGTLFSSFLDY